MRIARLFCILTAMGSSAFADNLRIGHLETNNDSDINWLEMDCDRSGLRLDCTVAQTLFLKKKEDHAFREAYESNKSLEYFQNNFKDTCKTLLPNKKLFDERVRAGKDVRGNAFDQRVLGQGMRSLQSLFNTCAQPTEVNAKEFFRKELEDDSQTCIVHEDITHSTFAWSPTTNSYVTQEGPAGACGSITIGVLKQDMPSGFWLYSERHIRTNPQGGGFQTA